jgi:uncharacterized membrane protein required for colicin V production
MHHSHSVGTAYHQQSIALCYNGPTSRKDAAGMALVSSIVIGSVLLLGFANGMRRGSIKEGPVLVGVLLGALLVEFWAERWGQALSTRSGLLIDTAELMVALGLLLGTALFSGYGSSTLLKRSPLKGPTRIGGAVLGLLNAGLLVSFTLLYTLRFYYNVGAVDQLPDDNWIKAGIVGSRMVQFIDLVLLGAAAGLAVAAVLMATIRFARLVSRPAPAPAKPAPKPQYTAPRPQPTQPAPYSQPTQPQGMPQQQPRPADPGQGRPS